MRINFVGPSALLFLGVSLSTSALADDLTLPTVSISDKEQTPAVSSNSPAVAHEKMKEDEAVVMKQDLIKRRLKEIFAPASIDRKPTPTSEKVLSKEEMGRLFGTHIEYFQLGADRIMAGCLFPIEGATPSACLDERGTILYKEGRDARSAFEDLARAPYPNVKGEEIEW